MGKVIATNLFSRTWNDAAGNADGATVGDETLVVTSGALAFDGVEGIKENSGSVRFCAGSLITRQDPMTVWARVRHDALASAVIGLLLRYKDADNYITCFFRDGATPKMAIQERIAATTFTRASYDGGYTDNTIYWIRVDVRRQTVRFRIYSDSSGAPGSVVNSGLSDLTYSSLTLPLTGKMGLFITGDTSFNAPQMVHIKLEAGNYT